MTFTDIVDLPNHMTWPRIHSVWEHHNGQRYRVTMFTNVESSCVLDSGDGVAAQRAAKYPTTIVYKNLVNGRDYSRRLDDWNRSMVKVHD